MPTQWAKLVELLDGESTLPAWTRTVRLGLVATAPAAPALVERVAERLGIPLGDR
ncbi:MAG: hypothetical protein IRZ08_19585 [Frankia sp.]|nr:hypothetical protein [Frankia sp.]